MEKYTNEATGSGSFGSSSNSSRLDLSRSNEDFQPIEVDLKVYVDDDTFRSRRLVRNFEHLQQIACAIVEKQAPSTALSLMQNSSVVASNPTLKSNLKLKYLDIDGDFVNIQDDESLDVALSDILPNHQKQQLLVVPTQQQLQSQLHQNITNSTHKRPPLKLYLDLRSDYFVSESLTNSDHKQQALVQQLSFPQQQQQLQMQTRLQKQHSKQQNNNNTTNYYHPHQQDHTQNNIQRKPSQQISQIAVAPNVVHESNLQQQYSAGSRILFQSGGLRSQINHMVDSFNPGMGLMFESNMNPAFDFLSVPTNESKLIVSSTNNSGGIGNRGDSSGRNAYQQQSSNSTGQQFGNHYGENQIQYQHQFEPLQSLNQLSMQQSIVVQPQRRQLNKHVTSIQTAAEVSDEKAAVKSAADQFSNFLEIQKKKIEEIRENHESDQCVQEIFSGSRCKSCQRSQLCEFKNRHLLLVQIIEAKVKQAMPYIQSILQSRSSNTSNQIIGSDKTDLKINKVITESETTTHFGEKSKQEGQQINGNQRKQSEEEVQNMQTPLSTTLERQFEGQDFAFISNREQDAKMQQLNHHNCQSEPIIQQQDEISQRIDWGLAKQMNKSQQLPSRGGSSMKQFAFSSGVDEVDQNSRSSSYNSKSSESNSSGGDSELEEGFQRVRNKGFSGQLRGELQESKKLLNLQNGSRKQQFALRNKQFEAVIKEKSKRNDGEEAGLNNSSKKPKRFDAVVNQKSLEQRVVCDPGDFVEVPVLIRNTGRHRWKVGQFGLRCVSGIFNQEIFLSQSEIDSNSERSICMRLHVPNNVGVFETQWRVELCLSSKMQTYQVLSSDIRVVLDTQHSKFWTKVSLQLLQLIDPTDNSARSQIPAFLKVQKNGIHISKEESIENSKEQTQLLNRVVSMFFDQ